MAFLLYNNIFQIKLIDDVIYIKIKNDLSFIIDDKINLYEHQSTFNPNMPLRGLFYLSELYQAYVDEHNMNIYSEPRLRLPVPQYIIFYNGTDDEPEQMTLYLKDLFESSDAKPCIDCQAIQINIGFGHNKALMDKCCRLYEYSFFFNMIKDNINKGYKLADAVEIAVNYCITHDILRDILSKNRAEVANMILTEYKEERHLKALREYNYEKGFEQGLEQGLSSGIEEGLERGTKEGLERGTKISEIKMILKLHAKDFPVTDIADIIDADVSRIEAVIRLFDSDESLTAEEIADML